MPDLGDAHRQTSRPGREASVLRRSLGEVFRDEGGQLTTEWTLLVATVIVPIGLLGNGMLSILKIYFYRVTGTIAIPFI